MKSSWVFKIIPWFIGIVLLITVVYWILVSVIFVSVVKEVDKHGLKSIVERVWSGSDKK